MKKVFLLFFLLCPVVVNANIMCNDGTRSPSCGDCHQGCCSHHGGCASNYSVDDNQSSYNRSSHYDYNDNYDNYDEYDYDYDYYDDDHYDYYEDFEDDDDSILSVGDVLGIGTIGALVYSVTKSKKS